MCGIAGILKFDPSSNVEEKCLLAMRDTLLHRGPDDAGIMLAGPVGLAHRRLSIIDLAGGHQPMASREKVFWITYNGELYNFRELRKELQSKGCQFQTDSDTEVILQAYDLYGEDCVNYLRGMFAFCIWDRRHQKLFMARDRLGIKPLYYHINDTEILFGSEIKAILAANDNASEFNNAILPEFLASRYTAGEDTFHKGVCKLLPAHTLSWSAENGISIKQYWQLPATQKGKGLTHRDYIHKVRDGIEDAVRSHLVSDVPVGLFLSGGIDSTVLGAIMAGMMDAPVQTFSVGFNEGSANELGYARLAARSIKAEHREIVVTPEQFFAVLPHLVWHEDEPIAFSSSVPLHMISCLAKDHVKVVLTGEGADELFLGYDYRYRATLWNKRLGNLYSRLLPQHVRDIGAELAHRLPAKLRHYAERSFLVLGNDPGQLFFENFSLFRQQQRRRLLSNQELYARSDPFKQYMKYFQGAGEDILQCMSHADMQTYLVELLMKQDQMSMSASIESRVPFLDHKLVELVAGIPGNHKLRFWQTKALLREAVRDLIPKEILNRKKMGFPVPVSTWLRDRFWSVVEEFVVGRRTLSRGYFNIESVKAMAQEHRQGKFDHGDRLWLLINFEMWQRIFIDGEHPSEIYAGKIKIVDEVDTDSYQIATPSLS